MSARPAREEITPTPTFRSYVQVNSLLPSDLFVFDRLGQGTLGIEAINFTGSSGPTGPTGPESGNLSVYDTTGDSATLVTSITFDGAQIIPPSGTGTAFVQVNSAFFVGSSD